MSHMPPRTSFVDYDPAYPEIFVRVVQLVHSVLPSARLEHVGSTSVPRLGGRGTLDVVLLSEPGEHADISAALSQIGFTDVPYGASRPALTTSVQFEDREYPILLYLLPHTNQLVRGWLAFREFMRRHPQDVERYAALKRTAIADGKTLPWTYQQAKTPYLAELAERIDREPDRP